jgi:hypothetical protein
MRRQSQRLLWRMRWNLGARNWEVGARSGAVGWGTALLTGRLQLRFPVAALEFVIDTILPAALWPWGRLSLNRNEYQECFRRRCGGRCKGDRCVGLTTLPPSCVECLEIWQPQPLGTLRAFRGLHRIALPILIGTFLLLKSLFSQMLYKCYVTSYLLRMPLKYKVE